MKIRTLLRDVLAAAALYWTPGTHAQDKVVAYVPNWIDLRTFADSIDYSKLTHINIAFENPEDGTGTLSFEIVAQKVCDPKDSF